MESRYEAGYFRDGEEAELQKVMRTGTPDEKIAARNRIASCYFPMVVRVVTRHNKIDRDSWDEATQIAMLCLLERIIPGYDPEKIAPSTGKPVKFITYAMCSIFNHLNQRFSSDRRRHNGKHTHTGNDEEFIEKLLCSCDSEEEQELNFRESVDKVKGMLSSLGDREQEIIRKRFGIGFDCMTLQQIGNEIGVSKERVRQIEKRALDLIRSREGVTCA